MESKYKVEYYELGLYKFYTSLRKARYEALISGFKFKIYEIQSWRLKLIEYK